MYSAFIDLCWVLGIYGIKGFTTEGKRKTYKRAGKCYNREMNEEYRGGGAPGSSKRK